MYALTSDTNRGYMRSHGMLTGAKSALRINARIEATARSRTASGNCRRIQIDPRFPDDRRQDLRLAVPRPGILSLQRLNPGTVRSNI